ncbi:MAG: leucine-rich repeat domain-containing protein [Lactobacillales bacterium]|jgi:hypothetical protein|nr:leucine-rich repeat domain-containing protein [Lactobacillales bacterium]
MKFKKISYIIVVVICVFLFYDFKNDLVLAEIKIIENGIVYKQKADKTFSVIGFENEQNPQNMIEIPDKIVISIPGNVNVHFLVTEISDGAFSNNKNITKIILPPSINKIGSLAFSMCYNLEELIFIDSANCQLEEIGVAAFGKTNLKALKIPSSIKYIR